MNMKKTIAWILVTLQIVILTACSATPSSTVKDGVTVANNSESEDVDLENDNVDTNSENTGTSDSNVPRPGNSTFSENISGNNGSIILDNAVVDIVGIENVSLYSYEILPITDTFRIKLFSAVLGDIAEQAQYDERNDKWEIRLSERVGDYFLYEKGFFFASESVAEQEVFSLGYRYVDLYPFDDNLLSSVSKSSMTLSTDEAVAMCDKVMSEITDGIEYHVDYIHAYGTNGRRPYYKIVYKQSADNMTVTAFNDTYFLVDDDGIEKVFGCLYKVGEAISETSIITSEAAIKLLKENAWQISFQDFDNSTLYVNKIVLEYIVVNSNDGSANIRPTWRFIVGENNDQINLYRDRIIAIDAITGDIIQGRRGDTF